MPTTGILTGTFTLIPDDRVVKIEIDKPQYDFLKSQIACLSTKRKIPEGLHAFNHACYIYADGVRVFEFLGDTPDNHDNLAKLTYFAHFNMDENEQLQDFDEFEGKKVVVHYRLKMTPTKKLIIRVYLRMTGINELQTIAAPPETAATPEQNAEAAPAAEHIDLAPVPLVPAPRPPRPVRRRLVPPQ